MGGHGGLNILPQKRWNVYNFDNREKVRRDEEAAAREEQIKRDDARKRDAELRLEKLRQARGSASSSSSSIQAPKPPSAESKPETRLENDSNHINLFEGIRIFDPVEAKAESRDQRPVKKVKKEQPPRVVTAEDEKYKLGYGIVGKGTKLPWYMERPANNSDEKSDDDAEDDDLMPAKKNNSKKTVEELRKERLEREKRERLRQRSLLMEKSRKDGGFSLRR